MSVKKILWIEEEVDDVLSEFDTYFKTGSYIVDVVISSTEAEEKLKKSTYDIIILDIRIIPGNGKKWMDLHIQNEKRLGLILLREIISRNPELSNKTIIFTNENLGDIQDVLIECNFPQARFLKKRNAKIPEQLEEFINKMIL